MWNFHLKVLFDMSRGYSREEGRIHDLFSLKSLNVLEEQFSCIYYLRAEEALISPRLN